MSSSPIKIGFIPLTDAAPIIIAKEKGFFSHEGLNVELVRGSSWSQIRDSLSSGALDASQLLAPMAPASWLPSRQSQDSFVTGVALNLNGNAITVSKSLYDEMVEADAEAMIERPITARALRAVLARRINDGRETITFGSVFPYSSHFYAIRYWLAAEGIDPDRDVRMVVAPPPVMVEQLEQGLIDAFCVGEPWNTVAESRGSGRVIIRSSEIWRHMPEKVLGVRASWADKNRPLHLSLIRAILSANAWLDAPAARLEAAEIMSASMYVSVASRLIAAALTGRGALAGRRSLMEHEDAMIFNHYTASFPWRSNALWYLSQMARWGQITTPIDVHKIAKLCYLPDLYREGARSLGISSPRIDIKTEGMMDRGWILEGDVSPIPMSPSTFIDGGSFDPANIRGYLERFPRHHLKISPADLETSV